MNQSLKPIVDPIEKIFKQYHMTIIIVAVSIAVGAAVFSLYNIVVLSTTKGVDGYVPNAKVSDTFDQATIDKINNLKAADENEEPLDFPARPNPFVE